MQQLIHLVHQAQFQRVAGAQPAVIDGPETEVARVMQICNACRYCEGFCAVFPAMTRRLEFTPAESHYLSNLCHNCGACLHACQYAPPHEFGVNVPRAMARVRARTYRDYAWPKAFGALYDRNGLLVVLALALGLGFFLSIAIALKGPLFGQRLEGNFYAIFPHGLMAGLFGAVFAWALIALTAGVVRFWRDVSIGRASVTDAREAAVDGLTLKYLDGGHGQGCNDADDRFSLWRRRFHHATFYGFMLCFAATCVATVYHYALGMPAPYPLISTPVLLGTLGGFGLLVGPAGLGWLYWRRDRLQMDPSQAPMDIAFIALLFFNSLTGLALMFLRDTGAMPLLLAIHLGFVMALFLTLPYGKFAHGVYRGAALLIWAVEKRQPLQIAIKGE